MSGPLNLTSRAAKCSSTNILGLKIRSCSALPEPVSGAGIPHRIHGRQDQQTADALFGRTSGGASFRIEAKKLPSSVRRAAGSRSGSRGGGAIGTICRCFDVGTSPRTISTSSRSCCPPDSGGQFLRLNSKGLTTENQTALT